MLATIRKERSFSFNRNQIGRLLQISQIKRLINAFIFFLKFFSSVVVHAVLLSVQETNFCVIEMDGNELLITYESCKSASKLWTDCQFSSRSHQHPRKAYNEKTIFKEAMEKEYYYFQKFFLPNGSLTD